MTVPRNAPVTRLGAALLLMGALVCTTSTAFAQAKDGIARAKQFFDAGAQAYESGQYLVAATAFEESYRLAPKPAILFSTAQAYRRQYFVDRDPAKLKRAVELYRQYVAEVPRGGRRDDAVQHLSDLEPLLLRVEEEQRRAGKEIGQVVSPPATTRLMITSRTRDAVGAIDGAAPVELPLIREVAPGKHKIRVEAPGHYPEELEGTAVEGQLVVVDVPLVEKPALLWVRAPDGAEVSIDGRPVGSTPMFRPIQVPAGRRLVTVTKRGHHPFMRELTLGRGEEMTLTAALERTLQRRIAWYFLGGAGLLCAGGAATTGIALVAEANAEDILDKTRTTNITAEERAEYERQRDRRHDFMAASWVLYGGGLALGATGALLYLVDNPRVEARSALATPASAVPPGSGRALSPTVLPLPGGLGVGLSTSF